MIGLAGFDFQAFNQQCLSSDFYPLNQADDYGLSIVHAKSMQAWRCIGIRHLAAHENGGRHNVFLEVLDEHGKRLGSAGSASSPTSSPTAPIIGWNWADNAPTQTRRLDKPDSEPAADIPLDKNATLTIWVEGDGLDTDYVRGFHARHADECDGNTYGHHSFYVVFQRQTEIIPIIPPLTLGDRVERLERIVEQWTGGR